MVVSLKPERLKRYKDVAMLLIKYGRSDLISAAGLEGSVLPDEIAAESETAPAEDLAKDLEKLGPTFIKLGQLLSTRADSAAWSIPRRLSRDCRTTSNRSRMKKLSESFQANSVSGCRRLSLISIRLHSLLHRCRRCIGLTMRDGRAVVVKVQRPDIRDLIVGDLEALGEIAHFLDQHTELGRRYEFDNMLVNLRKSLLRELDFTIEANNLHTIGQNLRSLKRSSIPEPIDDFTTTRVLTMEYISGKKITALNPLRLLEIDGGLLAEEVVQCISQTVPHRWSFPRRSASRKCFSN